MSPIMPIFSTIAPVFGPIAAIFSTVTDVFQMIRPAAVVQRIDRVLPTIADVFTLIRNVFAAVIVGVSRLETFKADVETGARELRLFRRKQPVIVLVHDLERVLREGFCKSLTGNTRATVHLRFPDNLPF